MKVLIVGSLHHDPSEPIKDAFRNACKEIGAALARAGFEFIVGSSSLKTADWWVLEGAAGIAGKHKVFVFRPDDGPTPRLPSDETANGKFIVRYRRLRGTWAGSQIYQIQAADCVLMVGGARGTAQAGYSAMALEKPVLAVASFGGSAADFWKQFEPFYERLSVREQLGNLREDWQPGNGKIVVKVLTELVRRKLFSRTRLAADAVPLLLNMALFAVWVWLFVAPPQPRQASFFVLLAASAFLGTALRASLRTVVDPAEGPSRSGLIAEFSAGLVLAFALALLYLAGSFTFTGGFKIISSNDSNLDDYQRVAVAMGLLGVAGGWLIERVSDKLTGWFSSRLPRADGS